MHLCGHKTQICSIEIKFNLDTNSSVGVERDVGEFVGKNNTSSKMLSIPVVVTLSQPTNSTCSHANFIITNFVLSIRSFYFKLKFQSQYCYSKLNLNHWIKILKNKTFFYWPSFFCTVMLLFYINYCIIFTNKFYYISF